MTDVSLGIPQMPAPDYPDEVRARLETDAREVIARYPGARSALLPLLHLVQAEEGHVTRTGVRFCAEMLDLTTAEVTAVSTFYSMYRRKPSGDYQVGVCTNTLCAVMGGDAIFDDLKRHLGIGNDETTEDGKVTLEHIECNAACDFAPVVMVNWEFFDNQTPESARQLVDDLIAGREVHPTRGAPLCTFKETSRILAGFPDERPGAVEATGGAGEASLAGLRLSRGETLPGVQETAAPRRSSVPQQGETPATASDARPPSDHHAPPGPAGSPHPQQTSASDPDAARAARPAAGPESEEGK